MTIEREARLWRSLGLGSLTSAILLMIVIFDRYLEIGKFDQYVLQLMAVAALAELLGITMLSVSRCMQRLNTPSRSSSALGWGMVALGLGGVVWMLNYVVGGNFTSTFLVFMLFAAMVLAGGVAMLGTERLLRRFWAEPKPAEG